MTCPAQRHISVKGITRDARELVDLLNDTLPVTRFRTNGFTGSVTPPPQLACGCRQSNSTGGNSRLTRSPPAAAGKTGEKR